MARNRLFELRNRLLTNPGFRRWVQKTFIGRWVANRQAYRLFRIASGFVHSQVLLACVRLDLFERLRHGPLPLARVAEGIALPAERVRHLLDAASALGLLEARADGSYGLGMLGAAMTDNTPLTALVRHHAVLYEDLADPVSVFANDGPSQRMGELWPYAATETPRSLGQDAVSAYTTLMASSQSMIAEQVLDTVSMRRYDSLLDIGGGAGAFVAAVAARWPHLTLTLADLPAVATIARERLAAKGLRERVDVVEVDAMKDTVSGPYDVVSLVRILHDHDDERVLQLLATARAALAPGGLLLVAEPLAGKRPPGDLIETYFSIYLLAMGSGRPRRFETLAALLKKAGFSRIRRRPTPVPLITSVIVARR